MSKQILIPPLPDTLLSIQKEIAEKDADISKIAVLVKNDIALYTLFLSAANNPWIGVAQPVTSVEQAIMLLGLDQIFTLVQAMIIRTTFIDVDLDESFWAAAVDVAGLCSDLTNRFSGYSNNKAYSIGMLHNAGIALMMQQFTGFKKFMKTHKHLSTDQLYVCEKKEFGTDHFLQSALMAKQWKLGEDVALTIRYQPIAQKILTGEKIINETVCTYLSILTLAKYVSSEFRSFWSIDSDDSESLQIINVALDYMHINHSEFDELKEDLLDQYDKKSN